MSPRSVKSSTFDDVDDDYATILLQVGDGLENANPMSRCTKTTTCTTTTTSTIICQDHVVEPPPVASNNSTIHSCPPSVNAPMIAANKSSDCGSSSMGTVHATPTTTTTTTLRAAAKATCQRRVIFPTYPRNQQQQPSCDGSVPLEVTTSTTTTMTASSFTLPIKTTGSSPTSPLGPRRASVLPSVFPSLAPSSVTPKKPAVSRPKAAQRLHVTLATSCTTTISTSSSSQTTPTGPSGKRNNNSGRSCSDDLLKHLLHGGPPPTPAPGRPRRILALPATTHHNGNSTTEASQPPPPPVKNEPRHRILAAPTSSLLRREPRYSPRHMATKDATAAEAEEEASVLVEAKSEGSSLPSLVDIKNEDGNNTDDDEDDDDDDDCSQPSTGKKVVSTTTKTTITGGEPPTDDETTLQELAKSPPPPPPTKRTTLAASPPCRVGFDPRIWIREFHRAPEEATCTWYTDEDMDSFRRMALDRILRYQGFYEIIPTGTGRTVQRRTLAGDPNDPSRRPTPWRGPIYSHAALTLDGENCNDVYMREKVLEKELCSILVVDPQELCCKLFAKALQAALPYASTTVVTANSSAEALKHLAQGKRFDLIIVEERLQLFQNHRSPQHIRTSSSTSYFASSSSTAVSSPAKNHASSKSFLSWPLANNNKNNDGSKDAENLNNPDASPVTGSFATIMVSGAALIRTLRQFPVTSYSLLIGVTAHLDHDGPKFKECGADFCWPKPPPPLNKGLLDEMVKTLLIKRGQEVLANELFG